MTGTKGDGSDAPHDRPAKTTHKHSADSTELTGKLAKAGHLVHQDAAGGFLVTKWGLSHFCADADELKAFAQKVGAR